MRSQCERLQGLLVSVSWKWGWGVHCGQSCPQDSSNGPQSPLITRGSQRILWVLWDPEPLWEEDHPRGHMTPDSTTHPELQGPAGLGLEPPVPPPSAPRARPPTPADGASGLHPGPMFIILPLGVGGSLVLEDPGLGSPLGLRQGEKGQVDGKEAFRAPASCGGE